MKYSVVNKFINDELCKKLIDDSNVFISSKKYLLIHDNQKFLCSSDLEFNELRAKSSSWKNLTEKLNSHEFLNLCLKKLNIDENQFSLENFFKMENPNKFQKIYKKIGGSTNKLMSTRSLIKYLLFRSYRNIYRKIKFSKLFYPNKRPVELLYDLSKAGNGYSREIHRDSDDRVIVFIVYLNTAPEDKNQQGGNLDIYKLIQGNKNVAQPDEKNCEKVDSIKPETGKLVIFQNGNESFHGVSKMKNHSNYRYFIYGGFTLLGQKNPYLTNKSKLTTGFHMYD